MLDIEKLEQVCQATGKGVMEVVILEFIHRSTLQTFFDTKGKTAGCKVVKEQLASRFGIGRTKMFSILSQLEAEGWIERQGGRNQNGRITTTSKYHELDNYFTTSHELSDTDSPSAERTAEESLPFEIRTPEYSPFGKRTAGARNGASPFEIRTADSQTCRPCNSQLHENDFNLLSINNIYNTTDLKSTTKEKEKEKLKQKEKEKEKSRADLRLWFDDVFWNAVPKFRRVGKAKTWNEVRKLNPDKELRQQIVEYLEKYEKVKASYFKNDQFYAEMQHPERVIRNRRWEDELVEYADPKAEPKLFYDYDKFMKAVQGGQKNIRYVKPEERRANNG